MFCLSKGLCAPVGSMLVGSRELIERGAVDPQDAGRRHAAGGRAGRGWPDCAGRDAGAAWAKITPTRAAWRSRSPRMRGCVIDLETVQTNIVIFRPRTGRQRRWSAGLKQQGVLCGTAGAG